MLARWARICLIIITVFVLAIYLPDIYWKAFEERAPRAYIQFSPVIDKFVIMKSDKKGFRIYDSDGVRYSREEYDRLLPLYNARQLVYEQDFPDSLRGVELNLDEIRRNDIRLSVHPAAFHQSEIPMYPMMESQSGRAKLVYSDYFFRIDDRMEFFSASANDIETELTEKFTRELSDQNFAFPAVYIAGNPTTRKSFDEGYFIIDSQNTMFHVKMVKGEPFVARIDIPDGISISYINVKEFDLREFYGVAVTSEGECYLISYDNYRFVKLPTPPYQKDFNELKIYGNLFFRNMISISDTGMTCLITDRDYQPIDSYTDTWKDRAQTTAGVIASYLFPFQLNLKIERSLFVYPYLQLSTWHSLFGILILLVLTFFLGKKNKNEGRTNLVNLIVVLLTGIYGFLSILLFTPIHRKF